MTTTRGTDPLVEAHERIGELRAQLRYEQERHESLCKSLLAWTLVWKEDGFDADQISDWVIERLRIEGFLPGVRDIA